MVRLRFIRTGRKNQPYFRLIATDKKNPPKGGRFLEILGSIDPRKKQVFLRAERIKYWLSVGAQPSDTVYNLLVKKGIIEGPKKPLHNKPKKEKESEQSNKEPKQESQETSQSPESSE